MQAEDWFTSCYQSDRNHNANEAGKRDALESTSDGKKGRNQYVLGGAEMEKSWFETAPGKYVQSIKRYSGESKSWKRNTQLSYKLFDDLY